MCVSKHVVGHAFDIQVLINVRPQNHKINATQSLLTTKLQSLCNSYLTRYTKTVRLEEELRSCFSDITTQHYTKRETSVYTSVWHKSPKAGRA